MALGLWRQKQNKVMTNQIDHLLIENFKSIKRCELSCCKRINLFIGNTNSGKSNALEALSLFSLPFLKENTSKKISTFIRIENAGELFYNGNWEQPITIKTNIGTSTISNDRDEGLTVEIETHNGNGKYRIDDRLNFRFGRNKEYLPVIRKYTFPSETGIKKAHSRYLIPPFGLNLPDVIERNAALKKEISDLLAEYKLSLVFDKANQSLKLMRPHKNGKNIFLMPYHSIGETLQRIIFYKAAMASNQDAVLLFEEAEADAFPTCIPHITQEMIHKKDNQYFVATHSPHILNDLWENGQDELAVFIFKYRRGQTEIRQLSENELREVNQNGMDLFSTSESYV